MKKNRQKKLSPIKLLLLETEEKLLPQFFACASENSIYFHQFHI